MNNNNTKTKENVKINENIKINTSFDIKPQVPKTYNVVLLNNELTFFDAVADVLEKIFNKNRFTSMRLMMTCHNVGQVVVYSATKDVADEKVKEAHDYCQKKMAEGHTLPDGRSYYYEMLQFETQETDNE